MEENEVFKYKKKSSNNRDVIVGVKRRRPTIDDR